MSFSTGAGRVQLRLSGNGKRVYLGAGEKTLVALDSRLCKKVWEFESPSRIVASPAVDQSTSDIYIPTLFSIVKVKDLGFRPQKVWLSQFNNFKLAVFQRSFQMLTPLITPNGVVTFLEPAIKGILSPSPLLWVSVF